MSARIVAIVLAAGKGGRMGGPKALLRYRASDGREIPLALAHVEARLAAESAHVIVVARAAVLEVLAPFMPPAAVLAPSVAPDDLGPAGSIAAACSELGDATIAVVTPVDALPARASTVAELVAALTREKLAARPRYHGRGGHPVVLARRALDRYAEPDPPPLRDHLRALGSACRDVAVEDPDVIVDLDEPSDLVTLGIDAARFFGGDDFFAVGEDDVSPTQHTRGRSR